MLQNKKFTASFRYDSETSQPRGRHPAEMVLSLKDSLLSIKVWDSINHMKTLCDVKENILSCIISLLPVEIAENRKRRWSKKYPIKISWTKSKGKQQILYLFAPTSRDKEEWYRRLYFAWRGGSLEQLTRDQREFFKYMRHYSSAVPSAASSRSKQLGSSVVGQPTPAPITSSERALTSSEESRPVKDELRRDKSVAAVGHSGSSTKAFQQSYSYSSQQETVSFRDFEVIPDHPSTLPPSPQLQPKHTDWINALAARLCWDVWHEDKWKVWVKKRIERKLARVKTPSFLEQLNVTDVSLGNDMPVINRLVHGPVIDLKGVWVYLDVTYRGLFIISIQTSLKLAGGSGGGSVNDATPAGKEMGLVRTHAAMTHSSAARALGDMQYYDEDSNSPSEDEDKDDIAGYHRMVTVCAYA